MSVADSIAREHRVAMAAMPLLILAAYAALV